ncbi:unnamed protein product [Pseudo-nitzschia multistriata]|uniref:Orc1-like AAA ATPase domain-containing protein n=1 Tax=Pseudo-nitzschia multistriata TaxID=183589 RepID=A0A448ZMQ2_9STRA|nr:unnamed protein product [Pseudo-nitzschia multistriata]
MRNDKVNSNLNSSSKTAVTNLTKSSSTMGDSEDLNGSSSSIMIDEAFTAHLQELGLSSTIIVDDKNAYDDADGNENCDYYGYHDSDLYGGDDGDESYLADLLQQRDRRTTVQREEIMEEALERFNAVPNINEETGKQKTDRLFLKLVEEVEKEMEEEFQRRNDLQDERIARELLSKAKDQQRKKLEEEKEKEFEKNRDYYHDGHTDDDSYEIELPQGVADEEFRLEMDGVAKVNSHKSGCRRFMEGSQPSVPTVDNSPFESSYKSSIKSLDWEASETFKSARSFDRRFISDDAMSSSCSESLCSDESDDGNSSTSVSISTNGSIESERERRNDGLKIKKGKSEDETDQFGDDFSDDESPVSVTEGGSERHQSSLLKEKPPKSNFWGRNKELNSLKSSFLSATATAARRNRINPSATAPRHVWIKGIQGIGKSSLVESFLQQDDILRTKPFVCRGIFEDNWIDRSKPFSAIVSCFSDLFGSFYKGNDTVKWVEVIQNCLDDDNDIAVLVLLIPALGTLLDVNVDDTKYSFDKRDNFSFERLSSTLGRVLASICEYSTTIFCIDNVHWAGDDSLQLLKAILMTENLENFFFIGCYRSGVTKSLSKVKTDLSSLFVADIELGAIDEESKKSIVRSQLRRLNKFPIDTKMMNSLMDSCFTHSSSSNPLFLKHLVHFLYEQKIIKCTGKRWKIDSHSELPSSLPNLINDRMEGLSSTHDMIMQSAALLEVNNFRTDTLMVAVTTLSQSRELDIGITEIESDLSILVNKMMIEERPKNHYAFADGTIRTAATSRIPVVNKKRNSALHWDLATNFEKLKRGTAVMKPELNGDGTSLLIVNHLNKGIASVEDKDKIKMVVIRNLEFGEALMKRSAFVTAIGILETGMAALDKKKKWEDSYTVTLQTHLALARCLYCTGEPDQAKSLLNTIIANGRRPRDAIDAFALLISIYRSKMQYEQAKQCTLKALTDIWDDNVSQYNVEDKFSKVRMLVQNRSDADLLVLPSMEHKKTSTKMPFLLQLAEISGLCRAYKLQDLASLRMIELTLKYGSCEINLTGLAFALCGLCVARRHLHGEAYRYGRLAEMMSEGENPYGRQAIAHHHYSMRHWRSSMKNSRATLDDLCRASIKANEVDNLSFQVGTYISSIFYSGSAFDCEDTLLKLYDEKRAQHDLPECWNVTAPYRTLMKLSGEIPKLVKKKHTDTRAIQYDLFFQMVTSIFMQDMEKADSLNAKVVVKPGGCWGPYRVFMQGLVATHFVQMTTGRKKISHQKQAANLVGILTAWTKKGMNNTAHMANILKVELTIASDRGTTPKQSRILLDTAITFAYQDGFTHHAALASERAGLYFIHQDDKKMASLYLSRAFSLYKEWGANAKTEQLERRYKNYLGITSEPIRGIQKGNSCNLMFTDSNRRPRDRSRGEIVRTASRRHGVRRSFSHDEMINQRNQSSRNMMFARGSPSAPNIGRTYSFSENRNSTWDKTSNSSRRLDRLSATKGLSSTRSKSQFLSTNDKNARTPDSTKSIPRNKTKRPALLRNLSSSLTMSVASMLTKPSLASRKEAEDTKAARQERRSSSRLHAMEKKTNSLSYFPSNEGRKPFAASPRPTERLERRLSQKPKTSRRKFLDPGVDYGYSAEPYSAKSDVEDLSLEEEELETLKVIKKKKRMSKIVSSHLTKSDVEDSISSHLTKSDVEDSSSEEEELETPKAKKKKRMSKVVGSHPSKSDVEYSSSGEEELQTPKAKKKLSKESSKKKKKKKSKKNEKKKEPQSPTSEKVVSLDKEEKTSKKETKKKASSAETPSESTSEDRMPSYEENGLGKSARAKKKKAKNRTATL